MGYTRKLISSYLCFIAGLTLSNTLLMLTYAGFNDARKLAKTLGINLTISTAIHLGISYYSKFKKVDAHHKKYLYLVSSVILYVIDLSVRWE